MPRLQRFLPTANRNRQRNARFGFSSTDIIKAGPDGNVVIRKIVGEGRRNFRLGLWQQMAACDQRDLRACPGEHLGEFAPDIAPAHYKQGLRQGAQLERGCAVEIGCFRQAM